MQIEFTRTYQDSQEVLLTLTNTIISGYSHSSSGDRPMENISLNSTKAEFKTR